MFLIFFFAVAVIGKARFNFLNILFNNYNSLYFRKFRLENSIIDI